MPMHCLSANLGHGTILAQFPKAGIGQAFLCIPVSVVERRSGLGERDWHPPSVVVPVVLLGLGRQVSFLERYLHD